MFLTGHQEVKYPHLPTRGARSEESLRALLRAQPTERLEAGEQLFIEGDQARHVFLVVEGALRIFKILPDGNRTITGFLLEGDVLGVSFSESYVYSAEAINDAKVRRIARATLSREMAASESLRREVLTHIADKVAASQEHMVLLSCNSAEERVCGFLCLYMRRTQGLADREHLLYFPMTRLDLGDYLGLSMETVSRTMAKLQRDNIISQCGRHFLRVNQPEVVKQLAGQDEHPEGYLGSAHRQVRH
ncbi:Crp/Fnr family transcriptional regulator [Brucella tritici]|uniref:Crp/Fnr family transcriptional regulator n=1 Tax=Brucella tritici TaxID=94626 RepID=UPI0015917843|nr:cyclic nucleotide-binding domain-containing protein [Brucella tritici]